MAKKRKPPIKGPDIYVGRRHKKKAAEKPHMTEDLRQRGQQYDAGQSKFRGWDTMRSIKGSSKASRKRSSKS